MPSIDIEYDNDIESEWGEIEENVGHLTLALSIATFDNHFNKWLFGIIWVCIFLIHTYK